MEKGWPPIDVPICENCQTGDCLVHCINPRNKFIDKIFDGCKILIGDVGNQRYLDLISVIGAYGVCEGVKAKMMLETDEEKRKEMKNWVARSTKF